MPLGEFRRGGPRLQPPICHRLTLLTATSVLLGQSLVARLILQEFIAIHPGRGFTHDRGLFLSPPDGVWPYALRLPSISPWQKIMPGALVSNEGDIHKEACGP